MATSRLLLVSATLALVFFAGAADAWKECPKGYKDCDKHKPGCETCIANDPYNCGDCGIKCHEKSGTTVKCVWGKCKYECKKPYADCDYKWENGCEVDTSKDPNHCGWCKNKCPQYNNAYTKCENGKCVPVCKSGWGNCDGDWKNGCEKDLTKDVYNCGSCKNKCPCTLKYGEPTCSGGKCGQQCKKGWKYDDKKKCCVYYHKH